MRRAEQEISLRFPAPWLPDKPARHLRKIQAKEDYAALPTDQKKIMPFDECERGVRNRLGAPMQPASSNITTDDGSPQELARQIGTAVVALGIERFDRMGGGDREDNDAL